jgi:hypothetical protein
VNGHDLQHWLEQSHAGLTESRISTELGRGPTVGPARGATWVSFESKVALGRVVLSAGGRCDLTATDRADGRQRLDDHCEITTAAELDDVLANLVAHMH